MTRSENGFTLIEIMVTVALVAIVVLAIVQLGSPILRYLSGTQARQKASMDARMCMGTIDRLMSNGKVSSLTISTPSSTPTVQNSHALFQTMDQTWYVITWSTAPLNSVHIFRTPFGNPVTEETVIAHNVTSLAFTLDTQDPTLVNVKLEMTVSLDSSGSPNSTVTSLFPQQTVQMIGS